MNAWVDYHQHRLQGFRIVGCKGLEGSKVLSGSSPRGQFSEAPVLVAVHTEQTQLGRREGHFFGSCLA